MDKLVRIKIKRLIERKEKTDIKIAELQLQSLKIKSELGKLIRMKNKEMREHRMMLYNSKYGE